MSSIEDIDVDEIYAHLYELEDEIEFYQNSYFKAGTPSFHTNGKLEASIFAAAMLALSLVVGLFTGGAMGLFFVFLVAVATSIFHIKSKQIWEKRGLDCVRAFEAYKSRADKTWTKDKAAKTKDAYLKTIVIGRIEKTQLNESVQRNHLFAALYIIAPAIMQLDIEANSIILIGFSIVGFLGTMYNGFIVYLIYRNAKLLNTSWD